jgi:hypothetical protein
MLVSFDQIILIGYQCLAKIVMQVKKLHSQGDASFDARTTWF